MTIGVTVSHSPWRPERVDALRPMLAELSDAELVDVHDTDYRGHPMGWQWGGKSAWILDGWYGALSQRVDHHVFLTDDLHLVPGFVRILRALLSVVPASPIALLANHPDAPEVALGVARRFYATNSWLTGPAYILPHAMLVDVVHGYEALPDALRLGPTSHNDDTWINHWVTHEGGGRTLTPLPGLVEHRSDLGSTVGHGDRYSCERISWRARREPVFTSAHTTRPVGWASEPKEWPLDLLALPEYWQDRGGPDAAPLLILPKGP